MSEIAHMLKIIMMMIKCYNHKISVMVEI